MAPSTAPAPTGQGEGTASSTTPASSSTNKEGEGDGKAAASDADDDIPIAVDFYGSIPGMKITARKTDDSDDNYVGLEMTISRSATVLFFSLFITFLMWGATIAVMLLVLSIIFRGRKIEVGMFSFLSALLFAMVAVRNSQPGVPPIGAFSDFISFFWAEVILALCLMTIIFTWLLRPTAK
jgi:ABC-type multidrug transport system fused ATPase/permease subunit